MPRPPTTTEFLSGRSWSTNEANVKPLQVPDPRRRRLDLTGGGLRPSPTHSQHSQLDFRRPNHDIAVCSSASKSTEWAYSYSVEE